MPTSVAYAVVTPNKLLKEIQAYFQHKENNIKQLQRITKA